MRIYSNKSMKNPARRGFTLVEILAVLVIIGIASAIVIPQLATRDDLRAAAAARILVADLIYAQNMAISQQRPIYVRFDKANNKYSLLSVASSGGDTLMKHPMTQVNYIQQFGSATKGLEAVSIDSVDFDGVDVAIVDQFTVAFDEMGAPFAFSYATNSMSDLKNGVVAIKAGSFTTTITIQPYTGELTVQ